ADQKDWDETLQYVCFAYNTARQESTGYSPFFLLYGREPIFPIDLELGATANPQLSEEITQLGYADKILADIQTAREIVQLRMDNAQNKQKIRYDAHHREKHFQPGDLDHTW
ncbi:Uncharacterized protein APZ42_003344, partial [Daphnia magna]